MVENPRSCTAITQYYESVWYDDEIEAALAYDAWLASSKVVGGRINDLAQPNVSS